MAETEFILNSAAQKLAYVFEPGQGPCVVFLSGYRSDMSGIKAQYLADFCRAQGQAMLRFDYSGHGASGGQFENGSISTWTQDALTVIKATFDGPLILVGSSMGGWIMLHVALELRSQVSGMIGVAAAPDFTRDLMWRDLTAEQRDTLNRDGVIFLDSEYDPRGYPVTKAFIEDGEKNLLLKNSIDVYCPVRLIQGMLDTEVPWDTAVQLSQALTTTDVQVCLVKNGDHRLSDNIQLQLLGSTLEEVLDRVNQCANYRRDQ
tara:strand:+ start:394 stop:1176 length:783 start_codon:yes stop_codon:yes gene_type:complete